jgi:hypothetical protein
MPIDYLFCVRISRDCYSIQSQSQNGIYKRRIAIVRNNNYELLHYRFYLIKMAAGFAPGDLRIFVAYLLPRPDFVFLISLGLV